MPISEDTRADPLSPYAYEKFAAEALARLYAREHGMETIILRLFNAYGPGQDPSSPYAGAIPNFMRCLKEGKAPKIFGDGEQTRDFVSVNDVGDAIILALELENPEQGMTLNIGSGNAATLNSVVKSCIALSGNNVQPIYQPPRPGDIRNSQADISKAQKCLGYAPKITLEEGLKTTWASLSKP
jgi:nucleoside-diphosphate-sugar epimerase